MFFGEKSLRNEFLKDLIIEVIGRKGLDFFLMPDLFAVVIGHNLGHIPYHLAIEEQNQNSNLYYLT